MDSSQESRYGKLSYEKFCRNYMVVNKPGPWDVIALRTSAPQPSRSLINEGGESVIVNLNVVMEHNVQEILAKFEVAGPEGIEYSDLNGLTETYNIESNSGKFDMIPGRGETVKVTVGWHIPTTEAAKHRGSEILVVKDLVVSPPKKARSFGEYVGTTTVEQPETTAVAAEDDEPF